MKSLQEARELAWAAAEHQERVDEKRKRGQIGYHHSTKDDNFGKMANTIRDLADEVEGLQLLRYGRSIFDHPLAKENRRLLQKTIDQAGGFFGPRSEMENHLLSENEQLRQKLIDNDVPLE